MMKKTLLSLFIVFLFSSAQSQDFLFKSADWLGSFSQKKIESQLSRNRFIHTGGWISHDTLLSQYIYKSSKKEEDSLVKRMIEVLRIRDQIQFRFFTNSVLECKELIGSLKKANFFCGNETESEP